MITVELNKGEKVTISSEDKDLTITVKEFEKFPYKEGDYLASSTVNGWTWFYVFKEFKDNTIYCYVAMLNSDLTTVYANNKAIPISGIKSTQMMSGPETRSFVSLIKGNNIKWNGKDKTIESAFKVGDIIKTKSSSRYYLIEKIYLEEVLGVESDGYSTRINMDNLDYTIEPEADLFFEDLRKNGLEYNATTNTVDKIKWEPKQGNHYYYISASGSIYPSCNTETDFDNNILKLGNCFKTRREAEEFLPKVQEFYQNRI